MSIKLYSVYEDPYPEDDIINEQNDERLIVIGC